MDIPSQITELFETSNIPLTLSDVNADDEPLVLSNKAFYRMTEFTAADALGANCRFLQGKDTQQVSRETLREDFAANRDSKVLIRNYRKSGDSFDNYLYIFTIFDAGDHPVMRIGSQFEVPSAKRATAFSKHASDLLDGLTKINETIGGARRDLINTGELVGASVKALIHARLDNLRVS